MIAEQGQHGDVGEQRRTHNICMPPEKSVMMDSGWNWTAACGTQGQREHPHDLQLWTVTVGPVPLGRIRAAEPCRRRPRSAQ